MGKLGVTCTCCRKETRSTKASYTCNYIVLNLYFQSGGELVIMFVCVCVTFGIWCSSLERNFCLPSELHDPAACVWVCDDSPWQFCSEGSTQVKYERSQHTGTLTEIQTFRAWGQRSRTRVSDEGSCGLQDTTLKCKQTFHYCHITNIHSKLLRTSD